MSAKSIRTQVNINEVVRESPDRNVKKIKEMSKEIDDLKDHLKCKERTIRGYKQQAKELTQVGPIKNAMENLEQDLV